MHQQRLGPTRWTVKFSDKLFLRRSWQRIDHLEHARQRRVLAFLLRQPSECLDTHRIFEGINVLRRFEPMDRTLDPTRLSRPTEAQRRQCSSPRRTRPLSERLQLRNDALSDATQRRGVGNFSRGEQPRDQQFDHAVTGSRSIEQRQPTRCSNRLRAILFELTQECGVITRVEQARPRNPLAKGANRITAERSSVVPLEDTQLIEQRAGDLGAGLDASKGVSRTPTKLSHPIVEQAAQFRSRGSGPLTAVQKGVCGSESDGNVVIAKCTHQRGHDDVGMIEALRQSQHRSEARIRLFELDARRDQFERFSRRFEAAESVGQPSKTAVPQRLRTPHLRQSLQVSLPLARAHAQQLEQVLLTTTLGFVCKDRFAHFTSTSLRRDGRHKRLAINSIHAESAGRVARESSWLARSSCRVPKSQSQMGKVMLKFHRPISARSWCAV